MITHSILSYYTKIKEILLMSPDLTLSPTLIDSNYPCLELILMVPKVFEPLNALHVHMGRTALLYSGKLFAKAGIINFLMGMEKFVYQAS